MKKPQIIGLLILGLLSARGALAQKVTPEFEGDADFTKHKTFAICNKELNSRNHSMNRDLVKKQLEGDIVRDLKARGLTETSDRADLKVVYRFGPARKTELETYPTGWYGLGTRVVRVPFAEGTLVVDLRDPRTRSLVWRAIASQEENDPTKIAGKLDDMVNEVLREISAEELALGNPSVEERRFRIQSVLPYIAIAAKRPQSKRSGEWRTERK